MDVEVIVVTNKCKSDEIPVIEGVGNVYLLTAEEKTLFRECVGKIKVKECADEEYEYDFIICLGEKIVPISIDEGTLYLIYNKEKAGQTYCADLTVEQKAFFDELFDKYSKADK